MLNAHSPLIPIATQQQSQRRIALRSELLDTGYHTYTSLAELRETTESSVRTWIARERAAGRMFTIKIDEKTIVLQVQIDPTGQARRSISSLVSVLREAGLDHWSL